MYYTIYKITNTVNNKIYIGKHKTEDLDDGYMGSGLILKKALNKYGFDKFQKEILYVFKTEIEMEEMEKEIVNEEFLERQDVYNLRIGGEGGFEFINNNSINNKNHNNFKQGKISGAIHANKLLTDDNYRKEFNERMILVRNKIDPMAFLGKHHNEDAKKSIGAKNSIHQTGNKNSNFGKKWIYNVEIKKCISVKKDELQNYLNNGWLLGKKNKF